MIRGIQFYLLGKDLTGASFWAALFSSGWLLLAQLDAVAGKMKLLMMSFVFLVIEGQQYEFLYKEFLYKYLWFFFFYLHVFPWKIFVRSDLDWCKSDLDWCKSEIRPQENRLIKCKFVIFIAPYLSSPRMHLHFSQGFPFMDTQPMWSNVEFHILGIWDDKNVARGQN